MGKSLSRGKVIVGAQPKKFFVYFDIRQGSRNKGLLTGQGVPFCEKHMELSFLILHRHIIYHRSEIERRF